LANYLISAPAQNALGTLLRIAMTLISLFASSYNNASAISFIIEVVRLFKFLGELRRICPIEPLVETMMLEYVLAI
jgi:hypothetical protein